MDDDALQHWRRRKRWWGFGALVIWYVAVWAIFELRLDLPAPLLFLTALSPLLIPLAVELYCRMRIRRLLNRCRCPKCEYDLRGTVTALKEQCPECGHELDQDTAAAMRVYMLLTRK